MAASPHSPRSGLLLASANHWVVDMAEASFEVDNYVRFVRVPSEGAVRNLASPRPTVQPLCARCIQTKAKRTNTAPKDHNPPKIVSGF